ncbi:hypothetical protein HOY82DRAFT_666737 [Tuber indicum]|nr:hypothetical protein HOY82DRAFT_666737 [Tuber indicum]
MSPFGDDLVVVFWPQVRTIRLSSGPVFRTVPSVRLGGPGGPSLARQSPKQFALRGTMGNGQVQSRLLGIIPAVLVGPLDASEH